MCTNTLEYARLEKLSLVHALVFSKLYALPGPLSSLVWKTPLHLLLPAVPFFLLLPSQVSSVCIGSYNSLCFLTGKHILVSSLVIQVTCYWMCKTGLAEDHAAWSLSV